MDEIPASREHKSGLKKTKGLPTPACFTGTSGRLACPPLQTGSHHCHKKKCLFPETDRLRSLYRQAYGRFDAGRHRSGNLWNKSGFRPPFPVKSIIFNILPVSDKASEKD